MVNQLLQEWKHNKILFECIKTQALLFPAMPCIFIGLMHIRLELQFYLYVQIFTSINLKEKNDQISAHENRDTETNKKTFYSTVEYAHYGIIWIIAQ